MSELGKRDYLSFRWKITKECIEYIETIEHMLTACDEMKASEESRMSVFNGDIRKLKWMKEVWKTRNTIRKSVWEAAYEEEFWKKSEWHYLSSKFSLNFWIYSCFFKLSPKVLVRQKKNIDAFWSHLQFEMKTISSANTSRDCALWIKRIVVLHSHQDCPLQYLQSKEQCRFSLDETHAIFSGKYMKCIERGTRVVPQQVFTTLANLWYRSSSRFWIPLQSNQNIFPNFCHLLWCCFGK